MDLKLENGDYCPDGLGGMSQVGDEEELLQRIHYRLTARRGAFPLMPTLGSQLHLVLREKPSARQGAAEAYIQEALAEEDVSVVGVTLASEEDKLMMTIELEWQGESLTTTQEI